MTVLLIAIALSVPTPSKTVSFVGFSRDESLAAWKVEIERPTATGLRDRFSLIRVTRTDNNLVLDDFRLTSARLRRKGGKASVSAKAFAAANPEWAKARAAGQWQQLKRKGRFRQKALPMNEGSVRVSGDADAELTFAGSVEQITIRAEGKSPIGFHAVARTMDGQQISIGHFRENASQAHLRVFLSKTGTRLAVLTEMTTTDEPAMWQARVAVLPEAIGSTKVGAFRLVYSTLRSAETNFKDSHPSMADMYDVLVGHAWN